MMLSIASRNSHCREEGWPNWPFELRRSVGGDGKGRNQYSIKSKWQSNAGFDFHETKTNCFFGRQKGKGSLVFAVDSGQEKGRESLIRHRCNSDGRSKLARKRKHIDVSKKR